MGLPVVSTPIAELVRFDAAHAQRGLAGRRPRSLRERDRRGALRPGIRGRLRRVAVARENAWDPRIGRMVAIVEEALAARL